MATYAFSWFGASLHLVNVAPFLMAVTTDNERQHVFSVWLAIIPLFAFTGNLLAGQLPGLLAKWLGLSLDSPVPYRYSLLIAAALLIPGVPILLGTKRISVNNQRSVEQNGQTVATIGPTPIALIALIAAITLLRATGMAAGRVFFNMYLDAGLHVSTAKIGTISAIARLVSVPAALSAPLLIERWGRYRTIVVVALGMSLSLLFLALTASWIPAGLGYIGILATQSIGGPAYAVFSQSLVSPDRRPSMAAANMTAEGTSGLAIALSGGYAVTVLAYRSPFLIAAALTAGAALLFWTAFRGRTN